MSEFIDYKTHHYFVYYQKKPKLMLFKFPQWSIIHDAFFFKLFWRQFLTHLFFFFFGICLCMVCAMAWPASGSQKTTFGGHFSLYIMWVLGIELKLSAWWQVSLPAESSRLSSLIDESIFKNYSQSLVIAWWLFPSMSLSQDLLFSHFLPCL